MYISSLATGDLAALMAGECLAAKVRRLHRVVVGAYDRALRRHGLTVAQLDLLTTLLQLDGPVRPTDLGRSLLMDRSTVSRDLARLERHGLVRLDAGRTGRERTVTVTARGRTRTTRAFSSWSQAQWAAEQMLGPAGVSALEALMERLEHQLEKK